MSRTVQSSRTPTTADGARSSPPRAEPDAAATADRPHRLGPWTIALIALVAVAVVARFAASLGLDTPWIAPDEMVYALLGRSFWQTGHAELLDGTSSFYGIYPALAGAPLAAFGPKTGLVVLKAIQALIVAVPVVTVYVWARSLARAPWALAAAAMTAALPAFVYTGMVMTEVTFLSVVTVTLWRLWRALLEPTRLNQALVIAGMLVAVGLRLKAFILLPAIVAAVLLMALFARDRRILRRFVPSAVALGILCVLGLGVLATRRTSVLGAYSGALGHGYNASAVLHWIAYEAADMLLLVLGIPIVAAIALAVISFQGRADEQVRALVAATLPYCLLLVVEVGAYVSRYEARINERALVSVAPALFVVLVAWVDRGMPRTRWSTLIALGVLVAACFAPVGKLITSTVIPDSFTPIPLYDLRIHSSAGTLRVAWIVLVCVALLLPLVLPRRLAAVLAVAVVAGLLTASVLAQTKVNGRTAADRAMFFGSSPRNWIDRAASGPVVYLDDDPLWAGSWHLSYWNPRIQLVATVRPPTGVRPDNAAVTPRANGLFVDGSGTPLGQRLVLAPSTMTLVGQRVAQGSQGGDEPGLTLWRTPAAPTVTLWTHGKPPDPVTVDVYGACSGELAFTVAAASGSPNAIVTAGGLAPATLPVTPGRRLRLAVPAPSQGGCSFTIRSDGEIALSGVSFRHGGTTAGGPATAVRVVRSTPIPGYQAPPTPTPAKKLAYCVDGNFEMLPAGSHPGATPALFVQGTGLTCSAPPGYVSKGYATADMGVPPGIYPLYVAR
jgi:hypothetical protein